MADHPLPDEPPATEGYTLEAPKPRWRPPEVDPRPDVIRWTCIYGGVAVILCAVLLLVPLSPELRAYCYSFLAISTVLTASHLLWLRSH